MTNYNPFIEATKAAFSTLSTTEAKSYYQRRAQEDIDAIITVGCAIYQAAAFVYALGVATGEWVAEAVAESQPKAIAPAKAAVAALPAISSAKAHVRRRNHVRPINNAPIKVRASYDMTAPRFHVQTRPISIAKAQAGGRRKARGFAA